MQDKSLMWRDWSQQREPGDTGHVTAALSLHSIGVEGLQCPSNTLVNVYICVAFAIDTDGLGGISEVRQADWAQHL